MPVLGSDTELQVTRTLAPWEFQGRSGPQQPVIIVQDNRVVIWLNVKCPNNMGRCSVYQTLVCLAQTQ